MPEQATTNGPATNLDLQPVEVKRNDAVLTFVKGERRKGKQKGQPILTIPEITDDNFGTFQTWVGKDILYQTIGARLRQVALGWFGEAFSEAFDKATGVLDMVKFNTLFGKLAEDFSARGETIKSLQAKILDALEEMASLDPSNPEEKKKLDEMMQEVLKNNLAMKAKKRTPEEEEEENAPAVANK